MHPAKETPIRMNKEDPTMLGSVKAKFTVQSVTDFGNGQKNVSFRAAMSDGNTDWSKYTPSGQMEMTITNPPAAAFFEPGESYFLSFTKA